MQLGRKSYNGVVRIQDDRGRPLTEVTLRLAKDEVTELMVAASQLEEEETSHAVVRDPAGNGVALYVDSDALEPLKRQVDWWVGPLILFAVILMGLGAFTLARGIIRLLF